MNDSLGGANGFMIFRMGALLASCIGGLGLIMAAVGVYGVVAFAATQRTREFGIRVALGATRGQVLKLVLRQGVWVIAAGAALGVVATIGITRGIANLVAGLSPPIRSHSSLRHCSWAWSHSTHATSLRAGP